MALYVLTVNVVKLENTETFRSVFQKLKLEFFHGKRCKMPFSRRLVYSLTRSLYTCYEGTKGSEDKIYVKYTTHFLLLH